ncbi:MAG: HNH endonuclease [Bacteroidota bacterium]|jgi:5-methylcytosine-specific restriction endonuclease McrA
MKFEIEEYHRNTSDDELIADLKRVALQLSKRSVTIDEYNEHGRFHSTTLTRRFGNWIKSLHKAGLEKTRNINVTDEEYFRNLESVWEKLGRQPKYSDMAKPLSEFVAGAYEDRFGTWRKALQAFVNFVNQADDSPLVPKRSDKATKHRTSRNINWRLRHLVMKRDNFKCRHCGRSPANDVSIQLEVDHIVPYSKGGETIFENLQTLCRTCNGGKSNIEPTK